MSLSDTQTFLEELVQKYDPDADVTAGSRAQAMLIEPILQRIGIDPFDEDMELFIRTRVRQAFPDLAILELDDLADTLIDPIRVLCEPLVREVKLARLRSSLRNIESLADDEVDALLGNFFEARRGGGFAVGVVRAYFTSPQSMSVTTTQAASTRSGLRFYPTRPQQITADQMRLNIDGSEYYFDINYTAENRGAEYNVEPNEVSSIANLPTATRVRNIRRFRDGVVRESSTEYAARVQQNRSDKTLATSPGILAVLPENFPGVRQIFSVGFRDPEMQRDVIRGGGLGPVPPPDSFGAFFGAATAVDDLDGDGTTAIFDGGVGANFIARLGDVGSSPSGWKVTLTYTYDDPDPGIAPVLRVVDVSIVSIASDTRLTVDHEVPLVGVSGFTWALRQSVLTISDIPGGITLPDTEDGNLLIRNDEVHIGGKTDIYVAGEAEAATAAISFLSDENPIARGFNAETQGSVSGQEDVVLLNDIPDISLIRGSSMSLVLEEGEDADAYLIVEVLTGPPRVRLSVELTGTQANLSYRIIDEIDVNLMDPRTVRVEGSDLLTSAGSDTVTTSGATNFIDANVRRNDILEIVSDSGGGEYRVEEVSALSLRVTPVVPSTIPGASYSIFLRSQAVRAPVMRVTSMELLDSSSAPTGTTIPYRDPVLSLSRGFQNEGSGFPFDNKVVAGLVATATNLAGVDASVGYIGLGGGTLTIDVYDPDAIWAGAEAGSPNITFSAGPNLTATQVAAEINANASFQQKGVRATVLTYRSREYVGFVATKHLRVAAGTVTNVLFGISPLGKSNSDIVSLDPSDTLELSKVGRTYLVEFLSGNNLGTVARIIENPRSATLGDGAAVLGYGPLGPEGSSRLYNNYSLRPDVGARARVGKPSVGSARVFFLAPTSAEFDFATTRVTAISGSSTLTYQPDPENTRTLMPPYPRTDLLSTGETSTAGSVSFTDAAEDFLLSRVSPGDVLEVLYQPIVGVTVLPSPAPVTVGGLVLSMSLSYGPFGSITFPFDMPRQDVVDYINERYGADIAELVGGALVLRSSMYIEIDSVASAAALSLFGISVFNSAHTEKGEYPIVTVSKNSLTIAAVTPFSGGPAVPSTYYRIKRYMQRISSTEMNLNTDASGFYYADVEMVSMAPGDLYNLESDVEMTMVGHRADGYRLSTDNEVTSFSRAEVLRAHISPSILLVGSSDSPLEYVQLSQQNMQVAYERSQVADDIQSFVDSDANRVLCNESLVRHLLPHYVRLSWIYAGGKGEAEMTRLVTTLLDELEPNQEFEVGDVVAKLRKEGGATSVYTPDSRAATGRSVPFFAVVHHGVDRSVRAMIVQDFVNTVRAQRFIPDSINLRRVSPGGIR